MKLYIHLSVHTGCIAEYLLYGRITCEVCAHLRYHSVLAGWLAGCLRSRATAKAFLTSFKSVVFPLHSCFISFILFTLDFFALSFFFFVFLVFRCCNERKRWNRRGKKKMSIARYLKRLLWISYYYFISNHFFLLLLLLFRSIKESNDSSVFFLLLSFQRNIPSFKRIVEVSLDSRWSETRICKKRTKKN